MELIVGEPLALDLMNTRAHTPDGEIDALADAAAYREWLALQSERLRPPETVDAVGLAALRELREQVAAAIDAARAGLPIPAEAVDALNLAARVAPTHRALGTDGSVRIHRDGDEGACMRALLAEATFDLIAGPDLASIKVCEGPQCRMLFVAHNPRRRWCSAALCGNRVRVARYYTRHKGER